VLRPVRFILSWSHNGVLCGIVTDEAMTCGQWALYEVGLNRYAVLIKLFLTKVVNQVRVTQRRKKNGSLLAAHILDLAFSPYNEHNKGDKQIQYVVICSEKGVFRGANVS